MTERRRFRYRVVDVFAERPLEGNPLAVFPDARGLDDATMQAIARELNLSETVFGLPASRPECAARLRCEQGTKMGRRSILHVRVRGDGGAEGIDVGGSVIPLTEATMTV